MRRDARAAKVVVPAVVFLAVLVLSVASGRPASLPGTALGSVWLLHVERASIALGAVGTVWLVGWRALHGHFPIRFGNIEYAAEVAASADAAKALLMRVKTLEDVVRTEVSAERLKSEEP
jgi:hypothetical protein